MRSETGAPRSAPQLARRRSLGNPARQPVEHLVTAWFCKQEVLGVEARPSNTAAERAVEQCAVARIVRNAVACALEHEQGNVQQAHVATKHLDHAVDLEQAVSGKRARSERVC